MSSLPPSASEVAGITSQQSPPPGQTQEASSKQKQRKLTPMPPPVGGTIAGEQKWVDKFRSQAPSTKQPRIEEWVSSTVDQKNMVFLIELSIAIAIAYYYT